MLLSLHSNHHDGRLDVRPLRSYPRPAYPRAGEPLRLRLDDPRSWPFAASLAAAVLSAAGCGLAVVDSAGAEPAEPAEPGAAEAGGGRRPLPGAGRFGHREQGARDSIPDFLPGAGGGAGAGGGEGTGGGPGAGGGGSDPPPEVDNPFTFAKSKLPPDNVWGKGTPGVLPEEVAVAAIRSVFAQRSVKLEQDVQVTEDGLAATLDGLSPNGAVGFEYVATEWAYWPDFEKMKAATKDYDYQPGTDPAALDVEEMKLLDADMSAGQRRVALVNSLDPRFVYMTPFPPGSDQPIDQNFWLGQGVVNPDEQAALAALVQAVHEFIDYLQHEGVL